ncbi:MAG: AAA-like domain-containing protein [Fervidobacterium sp.]|nr:AAA-like domain-containing protein [Fervidobacterium sp.]
MKRFCTTGPVDKQTCYYVERNEEMKKALEYIENYRYFTISAPRQTGKTTFLLDVVENIKDTFLPVFISFENLGSVTEEDDFIRIFQKKVEFFLESNLNQPINLKRIKKIAELDEYFMQLYEQTGKETVLMIDEFEMFGSERLVSNFLHTIREIYHGRKNKKLRSVILISVGYLSVVG